MFKTIIDDMYRKAEWYELPRTRKSVIRMMFSDGSTTQILYRMMQFCSNHRMKLFAYIIYRFNAFLGHAVLGRNADFGPGLVILHSTGTVINSAVKAGKNL